MWICPACGAYPHGVCGYAPQWGVDMPHSVIKQTLDLFKTNDTQKNIKYNTIIDL